jgi:hypothetical protein
VAKNLGVGKLYIPVLEESLFLPSRERISFLNGLLQALDRVEAGRMEASLILPAQKILGLTWVIPDLAKPVEDPGAERVFVAGKVRRLRPYNWWADPSIIQRRLKTFREALGALGSHPALSGLVIMDRALEWPRPNPEAALFFVKALIAEIQDQRKESNDVCIGLGWADLLAPGLAKKVLKEVDSIRFGGIQTPPKGIEEPANLAEEILLAAFVGTMASWLFERPVEVEVGWNGAKEDSDRDALLEACGRFGSRGPQGLTWITFVDAEPQALQAPPWGLRPDLGRVGLLDYQLNPKPQAEECIEEIRASEQSKKTYDFIDISREEYMEEPGMHILRLFEHFRE